jgi:hypothetical protein
MMVSGRAFGHFGHQVYFTRIFTGLRHRGPEVDIVVHKISNTNVDLGLAIQRLIPSSKLLLQSYSLAPPR